MERGRQNDHAHGRSAHLSERNQSEHSLVEQGRGLSRKLIREVCEDQWEGRLASCTAAAEG